MAYFCYVGVIWSLGDVWRDTRRFALMSLRDFGVGKTSLEERIQDEADLLMAEIRACNGRPFVPRKFLAMAVMNIMCGIVRGSRYVIFLASLLSQLRY